MARKATFDYNLAILFPSLLSEWDYQKNVVKPENITTGTAKKVWWICENNHSHKWEASIKNRVNGRGCPYCAGQIPTDNNNLAVLFPQLLKEWCWDKNESTPEMFLPKSNKKVWWVCSGGHIWNDVISNRTVKGYKCPYCSGRRVSNENSLFAQFPEIAFQWNYNKNKPLTPEQVVSGSNRIVWWICKKGHEWKASIYDRTSGSNCPYCSGRCATPEYNLTTVHSELVNNEWNWDKNKKIAPSDFLPTSNKEVWWKCFKGHEWLSTINNRTNGGNSCPYCTGKKVSDENSFSLLFPHIAEQWHPVLNGELLPSMFTKGSGKKAWWRCEKCQSSWITSIVDRVNYQTDCPSCNASKGEKEIARVLNELQYIFKEQYTSNNCKGVTKLRFDFAIGVRKNNERPLALIEYDGIQHFEPVKAFGGEVEHEQIKIRDNIKSEYCTKNKIPLIRIPYWEYNNIEHMLRKELLSLKL